MNRFKPENMPMDGISTFNYDLVDPFFALLRTGGAMGIKSKADACFTACEVHFKITKEDLAWARKALTKKADDPFVQQRFLEWFTCTATLCCTRQDLGIFFRQQQKMLWVISKRDPVLRKA